MPSPLPRQIGFIVSTEACERFSFYGVVSILTLYLKNELALPESDAKVVGHVFKMVAYFMPLAGAWLADRWLGRYRTILSLSIFYCLGHAALALGEGREWGMYAGLALIAVGAGGIKPCVSAFVGDQLAAAEEPVLRRVYALFYWSINLGALFAFALIPVARDRWGYAWAFAIPGLFMGLALAAFALGSRWYVKKPPQARLARPLTPAERVAARRVLGRIALVFAPVPVFWMLYDQSNTSWVLQGEKMTSFLVLGYKVDAERIQSVSALLVLLWVPLLTLVIYPWLERRGWRATPLRRMGLGMVWAAGAFVISGWLQGRLEGGEQLSLAWQLAPYLVLIVGEVMLSATGLEFAYGQAPASLRSTVMSLWLCTTAVGNLLVAALTKLNATFIHATGAVEYFFYAGLMLVVAGVFAVIAVGYKTEAVETSAGTDRA